MREYGGELSRFRTEAVSAPTDRAKARLSDRHEAIRTGTTMYPSRVFRASERDRVLIDGFNNAKIGRYVTKGAWAGMPIYTLSLEERATCPRSCHVYNECYGNGMQAAVRFLYDQSLMMSLEGELELHAANHSQGFVVRLHVLGDFPDVEYLQHWAVWSDEIPQLHVWGYTAHPRESEIGRLIRSMNAMRPDRWMVRFSVPPWAQRYPMQASAIWDKPTTLTTTDDAVICPQEIGKTATCGTCALCWNPEAAHLRILFLGHGKVGGVQGPKKRAA
jgi:hypothetical protein